MFERVERWLFSPGDPRRLAALRIGLCGLVAVSLATPLFVELAGQPAALFRPISFMRIFDRMPPRGLVLGIQVVGVVALVAAAAGLRPRITLPLGWTCAVFLHGMETSLGKVVHHDVLPLLALVPLLVAPTEAAWTASPKSADARWVGWPTRLSAVMVSGAYVFAGIAKLTFTGPRWVVGDNLSVALYVSSDASGGNGIALFIADRPILAHLVAASVLAFELSAWAPLVWPRLAPVYVAGAASIHLGIWAVMGLDYTPWLLTASIVWIDWPRLVDRSARRRHGVTALG